MLYMNIPYIPYTIYHMWYLNKYNHTIEHVPVIISTTHKPLWDNDIPTCIIDWIVQKRIGFHTYNIHEIPRHIFALRQAFEQLYGTNITACPFAKYIYIPRIFLSTYQVVQVECYKNIFYNESIHLHLQAWVQKEYKLLNETYFTFIYYENDRKNENDRKLQEEKQFIHDTFEYYRHNPTYLF